MASTTSTIQIIFDGAVEGLRRAVRQAQADIDALNDHLERNAAAVAAVDRTSSRLGSTLGSLARGFAGFGAAASGIQAVATVMGTLATVTTELSPIALALPGVILGIGVAFGTAKLALSGFSDALKGDAEALAQLSPAARAAVTAIKGLEAGFKAMRAAVQESFFKGLAPEIKATGAELLKLGKDRLPGVAAGFNAMAIEALRAARTPFFKGALTKIIDNTALALSGMRNTAANALTGFVQLGAVGSKYLPALGRAIDDVAKRFADWVDKGVQSGEIERMIDRAIQGFRNLGSIISNVFTTARSVVGAFNQGFGGSGGTLATLKAASQAMSDFVNRPDVQAGFRTLGENVRVLADTFTRVLKVAIEELGPVFLALSPFVQEVVKQIGDALTAAIRTVGPLLQSLATWLSDNRNAIAPLVPLLIPLALGFKAVGVAIATVRGLSALITAFRLLSAAVSAGLATRLGAVALAIGRFLWPVAAFAGLALFAKYIDEVNIAAAGGDPEKLTGMADSLHDLVAAGEEIGRGNFAGIMKEIGDEFKIMVDKFQAGESPAGQVAQNINKFFDDLEISLQESFKKIGDSFQKDFIDVFANAPTTVGDKLGELKTAAEGKLIEFDTMVKDKFASVSKTIQEWGANPGGAGFNAGASVGQLITDFLDGFATFAEQTKAKLGETDKAISDWVSTDVPAAFAGFALTLAAEGRKGWTAFFTETVTGKAHAVGEAGKTPAQTGAAVSPISGILQNVARAGWNLFFGETRTGGAKSVTEAGTVPGKTGNSLSTLAGILRERATTAWQAWLTAQTGKIATIIADVRALPGKVVAAIGNVAGTLVASGAALIQGFINGINSKIPGITAAAQRAAAAARAFFPFSPAKKGPFSGRGWTLYSGQATADAFATGMRQRASVVAKAAELVAAGASGPLSIAGAFEANQAARAQTAASAAGSLGATLSALAGDRETPISVNVMLSREQIAELARVEIDRRDRQTARRVSVGAGQSFG
jgi:phage-related protein